MYSTVFVVLLVLLRTMYIFPVAVLILMYSYQYTYPLRLVRTLATLYEILITGKVTIKEGNK